MKMPGRFRIIRKTDEDDDFVGFDIVRKCDCGTDAIVARCWDKKVAVIILQGLNA